MAAPPTAQRPTLTSVCALISWPDGRAAAAAREHPLPGSGRLAEFVEWLAATQGRWPAQSPARPRVLVVGSPHEALLAAADAAGVGVRPIEPAPDPADAFAAGTLAVDDEVERGADLLVLADSGGHTDRGVAAGVVVGALTGAEPVALLPRGAAALDTAGWIARAERLRDGGRRVAALGSDHDRLLAAVASPALAVSAGVVAQAAARRTALVLDGTSAVAAAVLCFLTEPSAARWWQVADTSSDPVHTRAIEEPGLRPVLDLGTSTGTGLAGLLALAVLRSAVTLCDHSRSEVTP